MVNELSFKYLPKYAEFLLKKQFNAYIQEALRIVYEEEVPFLKVFKNLSEPELLKLISRLNRDLLTALANNDAQGYIKRATVNFMENVLPLFESEAVVARDITTIAFIRRKVLRNFLPQYTSDLALYINVMEEVDRFLTANELAAFDAYLKIKQEKINRINKELARKQEDLLQAEQLAGMGSFTWDFTKEKFDLTPGFENLIDLRGINNLDSFLKDVHEEDRRKLKEAIEKALNVNGSFDVVYRYNKNDQAKKIWSRGVVTFQDQKPLKLKGTVMDITQKEMLIEQLQNSETLHKQAQALTHLGNWSWDLKTNKITWSDEMYRICGLEPQSKEITLEYYSTFIHPDDKERWRNELFDSLKKKEPNENIIRYITQDGVEKVIRRKAEIIVDKNNEPVKVIGTCQDVSREHRLNIALQEKENNLKQLINHAPDAIIVADIDGVITLWNPRTEEIFGWKAEEVIGKTLSETIIPPHYREAHRLGMQRFLRTGEGTILNKTVELSALNKQGEEFFVSLTISQSKQDKEIVFISFLRDISSEKQNKVELEKKTMQLEKLNKSLLEKNSELENTNHELESFNYVVSHDLQEPLRKIQIFANRTVEKASDILPPETKQYLDKVISSSQRMKQLIEDLLTYSQTASDDDLQLTDLNTILEEVKSMLFASIEEKDARIFSKNLPVVWGLPFQLQQLFSNLISNAIKYARKGTTPEITISSSVVDGKAINDVSLSEDRSYYEFKVEDNGIGFEPAYAKKVFDLFQRLHHKNEYSGTGIGLAICKKIVRIHNGFIKAEGFPGKGSVFYIYLPKGKVR